MDIDRAQLTDTARRTGLSGALWIFGLATTVLLIGLWGRAVSVDATTLTDSARAAIGVDTVTEQLTDWLAEGLVDSTGADDAEAAEAVSTVASSPEAAAAVERIVTQAVDVALAPPGSVEAIDVPGALQPLTPVVVEALGEAGVATTPDVVASVLAGLDPIVVGSEEGSADPGYAGSAVTATGVLTRVVVVSGSILLLAAGAALLLAPDRLRMIRTLATRLAVSAVTFAVVLRIGAWALDPDGGRSPVAAGGAVMLRSNGGVLVLIGAAAMAAVVASSWFLGRRLKVRLRSSPAEDREAAGSGATEDDTGERVLLRV